MNKIIGFGLIILFIVLMMLISNDLEKTKTENTNECIADCNRAGQKFFDYRQDGIFKPHCLCLLNNEVNSLW